MGLLEKASQLSKEKKPSLLEKAESFHKEEKPGLLKKAEKLIEEEKKFDKEEFSLPSDSKDLFSQWEEEAKETSKKTPIEPPPEKNLQESEEYLFDDESDFTTAPIEFHLASKKKIENYHAAFEIAKELSSSIDFSSFFSNINYSITGQVGSETFALLSSTTGNFDKLNLVEYQGFETEGEWVFDSKDLLYSKLKAIDQVIYANEILNLDLSEKESEFLNLVKPELIAPIHSGEEFFGILLLGKQINGDEYIIDDIEFIKVIVDIVGAVFKRILEVQEKNKKIEELNKKINLQSVVLEFSRLASEIRDLDQLYDLFIQTLKEQFGVHKFTFLIYDTKSEDEYKVFGSNQLSVESIEAFRLNKNSNIIGLVSNVSDFYDIENFRQNPELLSLLPNDELALMDKFYIIPLINLDWLVGLIIVHSLEKEWTNEEKFSILRLFEVASPAFGNILILHDKKTIFNHPFSPLENKLKQEIEKSQKLNTTFTVVIYKVQNVSRMIQLLGEYYFAQYCDALRKTINKFIGENDHYIRVGRGKFACIYHAKDKEETEVVIRKVKAEFHPPELKLEKRQEFKPSFRILSLSYPKDTKDVSSFLEMVEEA